MKKELFLVWIHNGETWEDYDEAIYQAFLIDEDHDPEALRCQFAELYKLDINQVWSRQNVEDYCVWLESVGLETVNIVKEDRIYIGYEM